MSLSEAPKPPVCMPPRPEPAPCHGDAAASWLVAQVVGEGHIRPARSHLLAGVLLHGTFLSISLLIVAASCLLTIRDHHLVMVPVIDMPLPGTCTFRELTGLPCPGCGLTRSFISLGHARLREAWNYNPAGYMFFAIVLFQLPYRIYQMVRVMRGYDAYRFERVDTWALVVLVAALVGQWCWKLVVHFTAA